MANPTFCALAGIGDRGVDADDTTPRVDQAGRPSCPGLIAASVWMHVFERAAVVGADLAVESGDDPARHVSPPCSASAFPMATTSSPTCTSSESPSSMVGRSVASTFTHREVARRVAPEHLRVADRAVGEHAPGSCSRPSTTWLLVTITPSDEITKPVPAAPPESGPPSSTMRDDRGHVVLQDLRRCRRCERSGRTGAPRPGSATRRARRRGGVVVEREVHARTRPARRRGRRPGPRPGPGASPAAGARVRLAGSSGGWSGRSGRVQEAANGDDSGTTGGGGGSALSTSLSTSYGGRTGVRAREVLVRAPDGTRPTISVRLREPDAAPDR